MRHNYAEVRRAHTCRVGAITGAGRIMLFTWLNAEVRRLMSFFSYADVRRAQNVPGRHQNGAGRTEIPLLFFPLR